MSQDYGVFGDVLAAANIGSWKIEVDEGGEPRMYADATMRKLIGVAEEAVLTPEETYHAWYDRVDAAHVDAVAEGVGYMAAGEMAEIQYPWHHPDGRTIVVRCGGVRDKSYTAGTRVAGIHQWVTTMHHVDRELESKQRLLKALAALSNQCISVFDVDLRTGLYETVKHPDTTSVMDREDHRWDLALGRDFAAECIGETQQIIKKVGSVEFIRKELENADHREYFYSHRRKVGGTAYRRCTALALERDENGAVTRALVNFMAVDDNQAKVIEQQKLIANQQLLVDGLSREYHTVWTIDGRTHALSLFRTTGVTTAPGTVEYGTKRPNYDSGIAWYVDTFVDESDQERVRKAVSWEEVERNTPEVGIYAVTYKRHPEPGKTDYHQMCFARAAGANGECNYVFAYRDVDALVRDQLKSEEQQHRQLEEALSLAQSASQAKTKFLFSMSHDIRTPMNAILGYTDIAIRHREDAARVDDCLRKIKLSGGHLLHLINDILEMSRIEADKLDLAEKPQDIRESIDGIRHMSVALALPKSIKFAVKIGELRNPYVYTDELHFTEVLINLISNAVKYTPVGGSVLFSIEQTGDVVDGRVPFRFEVSDSGIGMSEEFQKHLFETFSREQTSTVSKEEGTGLGLSIVKRIVDKHGGVITVKSKQGEGSTFTIDDSFPVMDDKAIEEFVLRKQPRKDMGELTDFAGKRLLLVEDNDMNREIATDLLTDAGLIVDTAEDGEIAVKKVINNNKEGKSQYDFILMDIQMPVMDGYEATRRIREWEKNRTSSIPIIALSANAFTTDKKKSIEVGMNAHVAKPIDIKLLFGVLRGLAEK